MKYNLKGLDEINNIVNNFVNEFGLSAEMDNEFGYWYKEDIITYTLVVSDTSSMFFMDNFQRMAPDITCDIFLASLLHEIGHSETMCLMDEKEETYCRNIKAEIDELGQNVTDLVEIKKLHQRYFDLPDETMATKWAIDYMRNNIEKVKEFEAKMNKAMDNFIELNLDKLEGVKCQ